MLATGTVNQIKTNKSPPSKLPYTAYFPYGGTTLQFSPFYPDVVALGASQNFGVSGSGCQYVTSVPLNSTPHPPMTSALQCPQAILDSAWSEQSPNILVSALGTGSLYVWDIQSDQQPQQQPCSILNGHTRECATVDWNIHRPQHVLSGSWDMSVKIWDIVCRKSVLSLPGVHAKSVQRVAWSPTQSHVFATGGGDGRLKILDIRDSQYTTKAAQNSLQARVLGQQACHEGGELLSLDWNKYQPFVVATSGTDCEIKIWDIRNFGGQSARAMYSALSGHELPVREIRWSPFRANLLASASYDMSVAIWDTTVDSKKMSQYTHHTEFVVGLDWHLTYEGIIASTSWDRTLVIWDINNNKTL